MTYKVYSVKSLYDRTRFTRFSAVDNETTVIGNILIQRLGKMNRDR